MTASEIVFSMLVVVLSSCQRYVVLPEAVDVTELSLNFLQNVILLRDCS